MTTWSDALHESFQYFPASQATGSLPAFLSSNGLSRSQVLAKLPYHSNRSSTGSSVPDEKRYRDPRRLYEAVGLVYEDHQRVLQVTTLGQTAERWLSFVTPKNRKILARHVALALSVCQLRNPTGSGRKYDPTMAVFPFSFIWRAMLELDGYISSDEFNRGIMPVTNETDLMAAIGRIHTSRAQGNPTLIGPKTTQQSDDRIIPWMAQASFGWLLFSDKRTGSRPGVYEIYEDTRALLQSAVRTRHRHREFSTTRDYVMYISESAMLPVDLK